MYNLEVARNGFGQFLSLKEITKCTKALSDLNNDGKPDVVTANSGSSNLSVRSGDGNAKLTFPFSRDLASLDLFPNTVALGDLNKDGRLDVVTVNTPQKSISIILKR